MRPMAGGSARARRRLSRVRRSGRRGRGALSGDGRSDARRARADIRSGLVAGGDAAANRGGSGGGQAHYAGAGRRRRVRGGCARRADDDDVGIGAAAVRVDSGNRLAARRADRRNGPDRHDASGAVDGSGGRGRRPRADAVRVVRRLL